MRPGQVTGASGAGYGNRAPALKRHGISRAVGAAYNLDFSPVGKPSRFLNSIPALGLYAVQANSVIAFRCVVSVKSPFGFEQ